MSRGSTRMQNASSAVTSIADEATSRGPIGLGVGRDAGRSEETQTERLDSLRDEKNGGTLAVPVTCCRGGARGHQNG